MKKILISAALAVMLVIGAFGANGAFAQDPANPTNRQQALLGKVASILGIDQQKVSDAFTKYSFS
ncbi:MAG: hypothetical protein Q8R28_21925 [Dehalococcoidia bacterium]|nr:hypothetical protein [Dehalococcoidia bacterium]